MRTQLDSSAAVSRDIHSLRLYHVAERFAAPVVALAALCLYLSCLAPSVATGGDCGELIAASYRMGIAHPSGYALYCVAGKLFATLIPFGEIAWRYNLFSAVCGASTCGLAVALVKQLLSISDSDSKLTEISANKQTRLWSACGAGLFLAGFTFFGSQALIAEVYTPTGLIVALAFWCVMQWTREPRLRWLGAVAGVLGLSLNLHLSVLFLWPGLLAFVLIHRRHRTSGNDAKQSWPRAAAVLIACFLIGLSVTLYLPLRAATFPEPAKEIIAGREYSWSQTLDWGHPVDFPRWKAHVLVQQYKSLLWEPAKVSAFGHSITLRRFAQTPQAALQQLLGLASATLLQFLWCTPLLLVGAIQSFRARSTPARALAWLFALCFAANVFIAIHYKVNNIFDIVNFLFPAYVVMAIWMGLGIAWLLESAENWGRKLDGADNPTARWHWRFSTLTKLSIVGAIVLQWTFFAMAVSWKGNTRVLQATLQRTAAAQALQDKSGRAPSLLMLSDDTMFPFWYAQKVLSKAPTIRTPWGEARRAYDEQKKLPQLVAKLLKYGPVAITQWRDDIAARFPYAPLTGNGNMWQLTTGVLPPSAKPTGEQITPNDQVLRGKFLEKEIRRGEVIGFQIDFSLPLFPVQKSPAIDGAQKSVQIGDVEVLVAQKNVLSNPAPTQGEKRTDSALLATKLIRRLVVPMQADARQVLRTQLPLEFPLEMPPGEYDVWLRLVPQKDAPDIAWEKGESVHFIVR